MSLQGVLAFGYDLLRRTAVEVVPVDEQITTDAGLLPIREFDERLGWTAGFAAQLHDARASHRHAIVEMVRQRVFGILAGYEDQNDHDALRSDAVFKIVLPAASTLRVDITGGRKAYVIGTCVPSPSTPACIGNARAIMGTPLMLAPVGGPAFVVVDDENAAASGTYTLTLTVN